MAQLRLKIKLCVGQLRVFFESTLKHKSNKIKIGVERVQLQVQFESFEEPSKISPGRTAPNFLLAIEFQIANGDHSWFDHLTVYAPFEHLSSFRAV